jgi:hypothetical protein
MRRAAPAMQYTEVPNVGHAPMLTEPEALDAIAQFLATSLETASLKQQSGDSMHHLVKPLSAALLVAFAATAAPARWPPAPT